jgi:peptidoglycan/LPS O-acetylase OafA/YrhL
MNKQPHRIPSLDGLRAISISLVVVSHLISTKDFVVAQDIVGKYPHFGALGVRIFFVISGFLITDLLIRELDSKNSIHLIKFYYRRMFRIFPPYYFFLCVVIILYLIDLISLARGDIIHALTYTINYHRERSWNIAHGWSLSVEEQFYLLWPATLLLLGKRRGLWVATSLIILCPSIRLGYYYFLPHLVRYEVDYRFETVADSIAIGCILAGIREWLTQQRIYHIILNSRLFILVPIAVLYANSLNERSRLALFCYVSVQNIGIAACIIWCVTNHSGKIGKVLNSEPMVFIGMMSYSIYLWQQLFLDANSSLMMSHFPLNVVLIGVASLASYYVVERPSLEVRQRFEPRMFADRPIQNKPSIADEAILLGSTVLAEPIGEPTTTGCESELAMDIPAQTTRLLDPKQGT